MASFDLSVDVVGAEMFFSRGKDEWRVSRGGIRERTAVSAAELSELIVEWRRSGENGRESELI